jgi:tetratricopeptide (TPR) repeat protein
MKKSTRDKIELALSLGVVLFLVAGGVWFARYLFEQTHTAEITIKGRTTVATSPSGAKGGNAPTSSGDAPAAGDGAPSSDGDAPAPDPALSQSPAERSADVAAAAADRGDDRAALSHYKQALVDQPNNPDYLGGAGKAAFGAGDFEEAEDYLHKALAVRRSVGEDPASSTMTGLAASLARTYQAQGKLARAEATLRESLAAQRHGGVADTFDYGGGMATLASVARDRGDAAGALSAAAEATAVFRAKSPVNPRLLALYTMTAQLKKAQSDYAGAASAVKEALVVAERQHGRDSLAVAELLNDMGMIELARNRFDKAEEWLDEALGIALRVFPAGSETESQTLRNLAMVAEAARPGVAERYLRQALALDRRIHGNDDRRTAETAYLTARYLARAGQYDEAEELYVEALGAWKVGNVDDLTAAGWMGAVADLLDRMGRPADAADLRRQSISLAASHQRR